MSKPKTKVDLRSCRLEVHKFPKNCQAVVLAEFAGGHTTNGASVSRCLTWEEWFYVLKCTFAFYPKGDGSSLGSANVLHFSERHDQATRRFSAARLFKALTEQGCEGYKTEDSYHNFYQVKLTPEIRKALYQSRYKFVKDIAVPDTVGKPIPNPRSTWDEF